MVLFYIIGRGSPFCVFCSYPTCPFYYLCARGSLGRLYACPAAPVVSGNSPQAVKLFCLNRESQQFLVVYDPQVAVLKY